MFDNVRRWWQKKSRKQPIPKVPPRPWSFRPMLELLEGRITPAPVVTGISPNNGPQTGATMVAVTGSGFTGATGAYFGGTYAMYGVVSDGLIDVWSPFHMGGAVDITVTGTGGSSATSAADVFHFNLENTTTSLSTSANPSTYGNSVTLTATVASTVGLMYYPSGTVTFKDGDTELGTATLSSGMSGMQATLTTSALALGTHPITAVYNGDSNFAVSTASTLNQDVHSATAYVWIGGHSGDPNNWNDAANWRVNGTTPMTPPGASSDVLFSSVDGSYVDCATPEDAAVTVHSLTIDSSYTGTLTANNELDVQDGGVNMAGGDIEQPNGQVSALCVMGGTFLCTGGNLNVLSQLPSEVDLSRGASFNLSRTTDMSTGDDINLKGDVDHSDTTGVISLPGHKLTFLKNTGVNITQWATLNLVDGILKTTGTGVITNAGNLYKTPGGDKFISDLAIVNSGTFQLQAGTLQLTQTAKDANFNGYGFDQSGGTCDLWGGTKLIAANDFKMSGGNLWTEQANNNVAATLDATAIITGGIINLLHASQTGTGLLTVTGDLNMMGTAEFDAKIDSTNQPAADKIAVTGTVRLAGNAKLKLVSINLVGGKVVAAKQWTIFSAGGLIAGDFAAANKTLAFNDGTGGSYTAGANNVNTLYVVNS